MFSKKSTLAVLLLSAVSTVQAQNGALVTDIVATPNYFVTVLFGVMLAIGFQFLLTSLSLAVGVTAIPNLKESYVEGRYGNNDSNNNNDDWNETNDASNVGVQLSSAFGIWNVLTAAISLFAATALALTLTHIVTPAIALTLGLTIWAVFYLLMFYLEGKMAGTLIGSLINTAVAGLRAGADTVKSMFAPSPISQVRSVADDTIEKLRSEMSAGFDTNAISDAIEGFTQKMGDKMDKATNQIGNAVGEVPTYDKLKKDLSDIMESSAKDSGGNPAKWTAIQSAIQTAIDQSGDGGGDGNKKNRIKQLKELAAEFQNGKDGKNMQKVAKEKATQAYNAYAGKLTDFLENATPDSFDTSKLSEQIQAFADNPKDTAGDIAEMVKNTDRETILKAITQNTSLDKTQVNKYADQVTSALKSFQSATGDLVDNDTVESVKNQVMSFVNGMTSGGSGSGSGSGLNLSALKGQLMGVINNPAETFDVVSRRVENYNREDLIQTLTNNTSINRSDINGIVAQVEAARNDVKDQLQSVKDAANSAKNQAARRAVIQAEGARKAAVAASWWLFASIVISGVAAALGAQLIF